MNGRPSETYHCNSKGCSNGYGSAFDAAPASWFAERGMTPPKNCPDCRKWIKAQGDQAVRCASCNRTMRLSARLKISHHKRTGPWALPEECRQCERGERPPRSARTWRERTEEEQKEEGAFKRLPVTCWPQRYPLDIQPANYTHPVKLGSKQTRQAHIEAHTDWSPHSQSKTHGGSKSPTSLETHDFGSLLQSANVITQVQSLENVREYKDTAYGRIVRVTLVDSTRIEVTIIESTPGTNGHQGHELVTTYDGYTVEQVEDKLKKGEWR
jgi:hypothetical protein